MILPELKKLAYLFPLLLSLFFLSHSQAWAFDLGDLSEIEADSYSPPVAAKTPKLFFGYVGGAVFNTGRYIGSDDRFTLPLPLVYLNYNDFLYWSIGSAGGWFWKNESNQFKIGPLLKARRGLKTEHDDDLEGVEERDASIDGGLNILWKTSLVNTGAAWFANTGENQGQSASLRFSKSIPIGRRLKLTPSIKAEWLNDDLVDHYYGIDAAESRPDRPEYIGDHAYNLSAGVTASIMFPGRWSLFTGVFYSRLGDGIADSPIVKQRDNVLVFVGGGWFFFKIK